MTQFIEEYFNNLLIKLDEGQANYLDKSIAYLVNR